MEKEIEKKYSNILGNDKIVDYLLEKKAKIDITNKNGYTILHVAAQQGLRYKKKFGILHKIDLTSGRF